MENVTKSVAIKAYGAAIFLSAVVIYFGVIPYLAPTVVATVVSISPPKTMNSQTATYQLEYTLASGEKRQTSFRYANGSFAVGNQIEMLLGPMGPEIARPWTKTWPMMVITITLVVVWIGVLVSFVLRKLSPLQVNQIPNQ
jgi:hypothetical protein